MKSLNRVFLMGYMGNNPELQISKAGKPYSRLSVATHRSWMNSEEKWEDKTEWHSVFVWGPLAERCCHNLRKGSPVFIEGALTYWQVAQQDGYKNAVHGLEVHFLSSSRTAETAPPAPPDSENLDNSGPSRNHNAVAHPA